VTSHCEPPCAAKQSLLLALVTALLACAPPLAAQAVLTGTVRQDSTGRPLTGIEVMVVGTDRHTVTDASGRYVLGGLPSGRRVALFRSVGFLPVQMFVLLGQADTVWANAMMTPRTVQLDSLVVTATPIGPRGIGFEAFEERRRLGFGVFFDSTELRRFDHSRLGDFLRRAPGMVRHASPDGAQACMMSVYIDGVWLGGGGAPTGPQAKDPPNLRYEMEMNRIAAVEFYRGAAEVPVEYGGTTGACGVVLIWTKR